MIYLKQFKTKFTRKSSEFVPIITQWCRLEISACGTLKTYNPLQIQGFQSGPSFFCTYLTQSDDLGRVVIPKEIRRTMRIREGDPSQMTLEQWERFSFAMLDLGRRMGWA